jgi:ribosomal subunit interface protein
MKIQVRANSVEVSKSLQVHVVRRLRFLLSRFGQRVGGVTVQISQIGANGNTANKRCEINVLVGAKRVCVEDTDVDFLVAITHATDRVSRAVTLALVAETSGEDGLTTAKMPGALLT